MRWQAGLVPAGALRTLVGRSDRRSPITAPAVGAFPRTQASFPRRARTTDGMSDADELRRRLEMGEQNAEEISVEEDGEDGSVALRAEDEEARLGPDEARSFADELEEQAQEDGWYHAGQTEPFLDRIREAADAVESGG